MFKNLIIIILILIVIGLLYIPEPTKTVIKTIFKETKNVVSNVIKEVKEIKENFNETNNSHLSNLPT